MSQNKPYLDTIKMKWVNTPKLYQRRSYRAVRRNKPPSDYYLELCKNPCGWK